MLGDNTELFDKMVSDILNNMVKNVGFVRAGIKDLP
jgi:hypothetical protein